MAPGRPASVPPARLLQHLQSLHTASKKPALAPRVLSVALSPASHRRRLAS